MAVTDWFIALPSLPLAISLAAVLGQGDTSITIAIAVTSWPGTARLIRAQTLGVEARPFIERAKALGAGHSQIMYRQVLPNVAPLILVSSTLTVAGAILSETTLTFLGLGNPTDVSWGSMLNQAFGQGAITQGAWWYVAPARHRDPGRSARVHAGRPRGREHPEPADAEEIMNAESGAEGAIASAGTGRRCSRSATSASPTRPAASLSARCAAWTSRSRPARRSAWRASPAPARRPWRSACCGCCRRPPRSTGEILFKGEDMLGLGWQKLRAVRWAGASVVFQGAMSALNPVQTVGDQIVRADPAARARWAGARPSSRAADLLESVGVPGRGAGSYPHEFSGGQRQRVMIAMALACRPDLIIADEPTTALDVIVQAQILALLTELVRERQIGMIMISHDLSVLGDVVRAARRDVRGPAGRARAVAAGARYADPSRTPGSCRARSRGPATRARGLPRADWPGSRRTCAATDGLRVRAALPGGDRRVQIACRSSCGRPDRDAKRPACRSARRRQPGSPAGDDQGRRCRATDRLDPAAAGAVAVDAAAAVTGARELVLEARDLRVVFPARRGRRPARAVDGVNLALGHGEIVALIGESGCGKSTLARALVGLIRPPAARSAMAANRPATPAPPSRSTAGMCSSCCRTRPAP